MPNTSHLPDMLLVIDGMEILRPVIDDSAILGGSTADYGYRLGEMTGEIWIWRSRLTTVVEVYPHDGKDKPRPVEMRDFDGSDQQLLMAIKRAHQPDTRNSPY